ncbi:ArsR/SmtB family transcription factor [Nitrincola iocasae]|uniref:Helix-turn-helix transcriptional regulator n=1 Tax=Nitrincola iocasae TaxID=2614693 RepID=A0A5J6LHY0_9GAMM|nr:metalloregulator ArsR/SmtB family transcription factor [Nitrincola iocasae]QEW08155.1 helix-turn-helix transcriptional regulator [Nitrincola iocasae]
MTMNIESTANALAALGHPARLSVFRLLVRAGHDGMLVGEIAEHLDMPLSTLAYHLRSLKQAGLILQHRQGREIQTVADYSAMEAAIEYLMQECCRGI